jgi:hypothetical protein
MWRDTYFYSIYAQTTAIVMENFTLEFMIVKQLLSGRTNDLSLSIERIFPYQYLKLKWVPESIISSLFCEFKVQEWHTHHFKVCTWLEQWDSIIFNWYISFITLKFASKRAKDLMKILLRVSAPVSRIPFGLGTQRKGN